MRAADNPGNTCTTRQHRGAVRPPSCVYQEAHAGDSSGCRACMPCLPPCLPPLPCLPASLTASPDPACLPYHACLPFPAYHLACLPSLSFPSLPFSPISPPLLCLLPLPIFPDPVCFFTYPPLPCLPPLPILSYSAKTLQDT